MELRKKDATILALEQLMASWQGCGGLGGGRGGGGGAAEGDGARAPDQSLMVLRAELTAAVDAAFLAQGAAFLRSSIDLDEPGGGGVSRSIRRTTREVARGRGDGGGSRGWGGGGGGGATGARSLPPPAASPLGGIPEAEWKLRALEEEVARMEEELRRERKLTAELHALRGAGKETIAPPSLDRLSIALLSSEAMLHGTVDVTSVPSSPLGAETAENSTIIASSKATAGVKGGVGLLGSAVAASAAHSIGLPVNLRIQALAQSLALLDEELEREREAQRGLRGDSQGGVVAASAYNGVGVGDGEAGTAENRGQILQQPSSVASLSSLPPHVGHVVSVFERRPPQEGHGTIDGTVPARGAHDVGSSDAGDEGPPLAGAPQKGIHAHPTSHQSHPQQQHQVIAPFSHISSHQHNQPLHHRESDQSGHSFNGRASTPGQRSQHPPDSISSFVPLDTPQQQQSAVHQPSQPWQRAKPAPVRTTGSDFEDLELSDSNVQTKKRGWGIWGWLTGADMGRSVL